MKIRGYIGILCCWLLLLFGAITLLAAEQPLPKKDKKQQAGKSVSSKARKTEIRNNRKHGESKEGRKKEPVSRSKKKHAKERQKQKQFSSGKKIEKKKAHATKPVKKKNLQKRPQQKSKKQKVKRNTIRSRRQPVHTKKQRKKSVPPRKARPHTIYINFTKKPGIHLSGWSRPSGKEALNRWGLGHNLFLEEDKPPLVDQYASFIMPGGAHVKLKGLHAYDTYYMFLDLVVFKPVEKMTIPSRLKIYADGALLEELLLQGVDPEHLYQILLPRDLTYDGTVDIFFEEYAQTPGFWGCWDIIVSTSTEFEKSLPVIIIPAKKKKSLKKVTPKIQQRKRRPKKEKPAPDRKKEKNAMKQEKAGNEADPKKTVEASKKKSISKKTKSTHPQEPTILEPYVKEPIVPEIPKVLQPEK